MKIKKDLTNKVFNRLKVIKLDKEISDLRKVAYWLCFCKCGTYKVICGGNLVSNHTKSCGCLEQENREFYWKLRTKHGDGSRTKGEHSLYKTWSRMKKRCSDKNNIYYFLKGIKVCDEWLGKDGYINFRNWATENGWQKGLEIDRKDSDGNYEPSNCRWATRKEQVRNTSKTIIKEYNGETLPLIDLFEKYADSTLKYNTLKSRIRNGWNIEKALTTPKGNIK